MVEIEWDDLHTRIPAKHLRSAFVPCLLFAHGKTEFYILLGAEFQSPSPNMPNHDGASHRAFARDSDIESIGQSESASLRGYPSTVSEGTDRPTFNIYATRNGDLAYEPDAKWSRILNKKGFKINLNQVHTLDDVENGPIRLFSQYNMHRGGGLVVNNQPVPMLQSGRETRYALDGFEHATTYVPNNPYRPPEGNVRTKAKRNWNLMNKPAPDVKCSAGKIACGFGVIACFVAALLLPTCL